MRLFKVLMVLPLLGFTFLDPVAKKNEEGNALFQRGEYDAALERYLEAQQNAPSRAELRFNVGDALYKQGKFEDAAKELGHVVDSENEDLSAGAYYNLGNALFKQKKYEEAAGAYKKTLRMNPNDQDAKVNLELALEKMKEQEQNKDQNKQDQDKKDKDQKKQDQEDGQDQQDQQNQDEKDEQDQQDQQQDEKDGQDQQDQDEKDGQDQQQPSQQQREPGELTPEEAARILDAMKDRDVEAQKRRKVKVTGRRYNGNAW